MNNFESNIQSGIDSFMQSILDNPSDYINTKLSAPESEAVKVEVERINQEVQQLRGILEEAFADELLQDQKLTSSEWNQIFTSIPSGLRQRFKIKSHKDLFIFIFCRNTLSNITSLSYSINREGHIISLPNSMHIFTYSPVNYAIRYDMQTGKQIYSIFELVNSNVLNLQSLGKIYHLQKDGLIKCQNGAARINPYSGELIWQKQFDKLQSIRVQNNECLVLHGDSMSILNPNTGQLVVTHQVGNHPYQLENAIINTNNQLIIFSPDYKNIECTVSLPSSFKTTRYSLRNTVFQEDYIYQHRRDRLVFSRINTSTGNILFTRELVGDVRVSNGLFHNRSQNKLVSCNEQGDIQELILPEEGNLEGNIFYTSEKAYLVDRDNLQAGIKGEILFPEKNIKPYLDFYRDINKVFEPQVFSSENNVYFLDLDSFTIKTTVPKTAEEEITINFPDVFIYNKESNVYKRYSLGGNLLSNTSTLPNSTKQRLSQYGINNTQRLHSLELADHIVSRREAFDAKRFEEFTNKPLRVIFHGSEDEHGAFDINSTHNLLSSDANLLYFEIHSEQEFFSNLDRLKNMGVPIELLVISGHGSERFLAFGGANPEGLQTVEDETQYLDIHDREQLVGYSQLLRNGAIVLNSCSTGGQILGYNLQEILAETIGQFATVYAPNKSFQRERISIRDTVEVDFGGSAKVVLIDNIPKNQKSPHESASSTPPQQ